MRISIIAAVAENNVIGKDNKLIWHISEDLQRFKKLTSGHVIIMGRKTYESLPFKPLPDRKNIVISGQKDIDFKGALVVNCIEDALDECEGEEEIFICGGSSIYDYFIRTADKLYLTKVHQAFDGDTFFPYFSDNDWEVKYQSEKYYDEKSGLEYTFVDYTKIID